MKRFPIRNLDSPRDVKPRVFDIVVDGDESYFEVKQAQKRYERVKVKDVIKQLEEAQNQTVKSAQDTSDDVIR